MAHSVDAAAKANALSSSVVLAAKKTGVAGLEWWMFLHSGRFFVISIYLLGEDLHLGPSHIPSKRDLSLNSENFLKGGKHVGTLPQEWPANCQLDTSQLKNGSVRHVILPCFCRSSFQSRGKMV